MCALWNELNTILYSVSHDQHMNTNIWFFVCIIRKCLFDFIRAIVDIYQICLICVLFINDSKAEANRQLFVCCSFDRTRNAIERVALPKMHMVQCILCKQCTICCFGVMFQSTTWLVFMIWMVLYIQIHQWLRVDTNTSYALSLHSNLVCTIALAFSQFRTKRYRHARARTPERRFVIYRVCSCSQFKAIFRAVNSELCNANGRSLTSSRVEIQGRFMNMKNPIPLYAHSQSYGEWKYDWQLFAWLSHNYR